MGTESASVRNAGAIAIAAVAIGLLARGRAWQAWNLSRERARAIKVSEACDRSARGAGIVLVR